MSSDTRTSFLRSSNLRVTLLTLYQGPQASGDSILAASSRPPRGLPAATLHFVAPHVGSQKTLQICVFLVQVPSLRLPWAPLDAQICEHGPKIDENQRKSTKSMKINQNKRNPRKYYKINENRAQVVTGPS